jgi:2'-5' RNA ligase
MDTEYPDARPYFAGPQREDSSPDKTHKAALVIVPPHELCEPIEAIRRKHDRKVGRWMPHINLVYPFRPRRQFGVAAQRATEACRRIEPFEIALTSFHTFNHGESLTMWLDPVPNEPLVELHRALVDVFPDCDEVGRFDTGFTPHLSVGQAKTQEEADALVAEFAKSWQPITFTVDGIALIWRSLQTQDVFKVDRRIRLGGGAEASSAALPSGKPARA